VAKRVHRRSEEHQSGEDAAVAWFGLRFGATPKFAHQSKQLIDADARCDLFQRAESHDAIAIDHKRGRESDAAFFTRVEQAVCVDDLAPCVAQQWKFDSKLLANRLRTSGVVHGNRDQLGAGLAKILEMLRVVRQLAEAKRSPVSAVENDDARSAGDQVVEPAHDASRVCERELGSLFAYRRDFAFAHAHNNSRARALEEHRAFADDRASPADSDRERAAVLARDLDANLTRPSHLYALLDQEFSPRRRID
jgi:hypothetical protein